jgi:hypothetical protein
MNNSILFKTLCEHFELNERIFNEAVAQNNQQAKEKERTRSIVIYEVVSRLGLIKDFCEKYPHKAYEAIEFIINNRLYEILREKGIE